MFSKLRMNIYYSKKWSVLVFAISVSFLLLYTYEGLFSINNWVYHPYGDAIKNYFHVLISAKNADGLWVNSVNYPYGENLFFLDAQILLSKFLDFLNLEDYSVGFINFLPLFSISIASVFIFFTQRILKIPLILNVITSIIIAFLSPQIARADGHFALAYTFFIPSIIYFLINKNIKSEIKHFILFIIILSFSFLHPYYLLIGIVMLVAFLPYHVLFKLNKKAISYNILTIFFTVIIIKATMVLSDNIIDRPESPFGIWAYKSTFEDVFLPRYKPYAELFKSLEHLKTFEGNAYVGVLGFPVLLISGIILILKFINKKSVVCFFRNKAFFSFFFSSIIIWLFSLYYPFKFIIDTALELIPPLKQFRSIGRFAWIFYYTFSIFISLSLFHFYIFLKSKTNIYISSVIVILLCGLWFLDANGNMNTIKYKIENRTEINFNKSSFLNDYETSILLQQNFNVIVCLPFFSIGSEIENYESYSNAILETFKITNVTNIPYYSTYSSRVSKSQFLKVKDLKFGEKNIDEIFTKNEKILLIYNKEHLNKFEKIISENAKILFDKGEIIYAIY